MHIRTDMHKYILTILSFVVPMWLSVQSTVLPMLAEKTAVLVKLPQRPYDHCRICLWTKEVQQNQLSPIYQWLVL